MVAVVDLEAEILKEEEEEEEDHLEEEEAKNEGFERLILTLQ